jgi:hypothetical protein
LKIDTAHCVGAASELMAAGYFLGLGHQVYVPIVRQGKVDFIIEQFEPHTLTRVQVKTASVNKAGSFTFLQCRTLTTNKRKRLPKDNDYDLLCIVYGTEIWIIPAKDIHSSNISLRSLAYPSHARKWDKYKVQ